MYNLVERFESEHFLVSITVVWCTFLYSKPEYVTFDYAVFRYGFDIIIILIIQDQISFLYFFIVGFLSLTVNSLLLSCHCNVNAIISESNDESCLMFQVDKN